MSIVCALFFNFFFLPPFGTFTIEDPQNWVAFFAFLLTALVTSQLSARAKRRTLEATRRQEEMERLYELSRALLLVDKSAATAGQISRDIARVFELKAVAVFDRQTDSVYRNGKTDLPLSDTKLNGVTRQGTAFQDPAANCFVLPLSLGAEPVGSLAIHGASISDTALQAIGNLAAIVIERARAEEAANRMEVTRQNEAM